MRSAEDLSFPLEIETVVIGMGMGMGMGMAFLSTEPQREPAQGLSPHPVVCMEWVRAWLNEALRH